jgi:hypothetical protein
LVEHFSSQIEFRDKLAKQLEIQLCTLLAAEAEGGRGGLAVPPATDIQLAFAEPESGTRIGDRLSLATTLLDVTDSEQLPDCSAPSKRTKAPARRCDIYIIGAGDSDNKDYFREMVQYIKRTQFFRPIHFWLKNVGAVGARDMYVDVRIEAETPLAASTIAAARSVAPSTSSGMFLNWTFPSAESTDRKATIQPRGSAWSTSLELPALQPQREVSPQPQVVLGLEASGRVTITARIYADTLPEPVSRKLEIDWAVERKTIGALELLEDYVQASVQRSGPRAAEQAQ